MKNEQLPLQIQAQPDTARHQRYRPNTQERAFAALALLLGNDTGAEARFQAARRLARQGPALLPMLLETLNRCPEFTSPSWPWWPPQYEPCGWLLLHLSRAAQARLDMLLHHPVVSQPAGLVLWTSVIEAAARAPRDGYESLLRAGLQSPWHNTRYAAAIALGNLAGIVALADTSITALRACLHEDHALPLRLAAAHALLRHGDNQGLAGLIALLDASMPDEMRKAAAFVLASESPLRALDALQRSQLLQWALTALEDRDADIGLYAADILSGIAALSTLPLLRPVLASSDPQAQIATLSALEGIAGQKAMRFAVYQCALPAQIVTLLRSAFPEVRRQAAYTLAALGGTYAMAALGTTLLNDDQRGRIEAIEGLRLLPDALRPQRRERIARWLLCVLREAAAEAQEEAQVTALDSLAYLAWQARRRGRQAASRALAEITWRDGTAQQLLASSSAWVRQRAIEFLGMLDNAPLDCLMQIIAILHSDDDSGVRACAAYMLGQMDERQAIPDLILALLDPDVNVAETALNTLGRLASPDDSIVAYILRELAASFGKKKRAGDQLAQAARAVLREWKQ